MKKKTLMSGVCFLIAVFGLCITSYFVHDTFTVKKDGTIKV